MYDRKIKNYSNFFKVLSNDVRIKILFELAFSNKNYTYLMEKLDLKQSTLSNHISKLREFLQNMIENFFLKLGSETGVQVTNEGEE